MNDCRWNWQNVDILIVFSYDLLSFLLLLPFLFNGLEGEYRSERKTRWNFSLFFVFSFRLRSIWWESMCFQWNIFHRKWKKRFDKDKNQLKFLTNSVCYFSIFWTNLFFIDLFQLTTQWYLIFFFIIIIVDINISIFFDNFH